VDNFKLLSIGVDTAEFPPLEEQMTVSENLLKTNPEHFAFVSTFKMHGWDATDWQERTIRYLDETFSRGAIAVKIWKNIGMEFLDAHGKFVMVDDAKFDPIFQDLSQKNIPMTGHLGEPKDCWLPIQDISIKYIRDYFQTHPQYHMYLHPEFPAYDEQIAARDRMLEKNRQLSFIAVHLASIEWDIDELAGFLDTYSNAVVDLSARLMYLQYHSSQDRKKVRDFFLKYQDRILYGTDIIQDPDIDPNQFKEEVHNKWSEDWKYLTTREIMQTDEFDMSFQGLELPRQVIEKIYRINAQKLFPNAWKNKNGRNI
jgi:predicted TIM-barrel fold metal-dependent hydrolase